ncbi:MAG: FAD-linked oxidase C-terminal domain-containing protein [Syntrophales bacterium]|nr:FAD-linked oxidase C-terminal domain-containing protein [Syntrophales bacterium]
MPEYTPITAEIRTRIAAIPGLSMIDDPETLETFGKDKTPGAFHRPELVVEATEANQIQALLRLANDCRFPVIPRGLGTGLAGGAIPIRGGVVLSLARMNRIIAIEPRNMIAVVEPGVRNLDLKNAVREHGLCYPPDPASNDACSIGGNAATNAGGPACVKYGTTRDYILGLEAVLPGGELIDVGVRTRKGVVGYDMTRLLVGSEGTLGVITKLIVRLLPDPADVTTLVALFPKLARAMETITTILMRGYMPSTLEFMDSRCLELVGDILPFAGVKEAGAMLLIESDGAPETIRREIAAIRGICLEGGAGGALVAPDAEKRKQMWDVRRAISLRIEEAHPLDIQEDIVVPLGRIAEFVGCLPVYEAAHGVRIYAFGHAGDGNIHLSVTSGSLDARKTAETAVREIIQKVIAMGGTMSGEHGVGFAKQPFLPLELSPENIRLQRAIKLLFDPNLILNPGKLFA